MNTICITDEVPQCVMMDAILAKLASCGNFTSYTEVTEDGGRTVRVVTAHGTEMKVIYAPIRDREVFNRCEFTRYFKDEGVCGDTVAVTHRTASTMALIPLLWPSQWRRTMNRKASPVSDDSPALVITGRLYRKDTALRDVQKA